MKYVLRAGLLLAALALSRPAAAQEYRDLKLVDGRDLVVQIVATEAGGLRVETPQGGMLVDFTLLYDMSPVTQAEYDAERDWVVYVAVPPEHRAEIVDALKVVPHVQVVNEPGATMTGLSPAQRSAADACGADVDCIVKATADAPWLWVIGGKMDGAELVLESQTNKSKDRNARQVLTQFGKDAVRSAVWDAIDVTPTPEAIAAVDAPPATGKKGHKAPKATTPGAAPTEPAPAAASDSHLLSLAYAPVPGLPAFAAHDAGRGVLALAVALPATALWVGAVGHGAESPAQHVALGVVGFYAITVATNQALAIHHGNTSVGMAPTEGGATVTLAVVK